MLTDDFIRLRSLSGVHTSIIQIILDRGFVMVWTYRFFSAWRTSFFEFRQLRGLLESFWFLLSGSMLPSGCKIGRGLVVFHGIAVIVNSKVLMGENVTLYHGVTIGERFPGDKCPILGNSVVVGAGACILGPVTIPSHSIVPANTVVTPASITNIKQCKFK